MSTAKFLNVLPPEDEALIPAERLPEFLPVARQTLARWRSEGSGPAFVKVGRKVAYRSADVRAWVASSVHGGRAA